MSEDCPPTDRDNLEDQIFGAIAGLERLSGCALSDLILIRDISKIRAVAETAFSNILRPRNACSIDAAPCQILDEMARVLGEVVVLQDRAREALEARVNSDLLQEESGITSGWVH